MLKAGAKSVAMVLYGSETMAQKNANMSLQQAEKVTADILQCARQVGNNVIATIAVAFTCPFVPGASGNVATEDVAMLLEQMGFTTGIDLTKLLHASDLAEEMSGTAPGGRAKPWLKPWLTKQAERQLL